MATFEEDYQFDKAMNEEGETKDSVVKSGHDFLGDNNFTSSESSSTMKEEGLRCPWSPQKNNAINLVPYLLKRKNRDGKNECKERSISTMKEESGHDFLGDNNFTSSESSTMEEESGHDFLGDNNFTSSESSTMEESGHDFLGDNNFTSSESSSTMEEGKLCPLRASVIVEGKKDADAENSGHMASYDWRIFLIGFY